MSSDMSGPLSDMPDGTTFNAQMANTCLPAGERPNKTPIFISGVRDTRAFLAWLRATCPGGLAAQLKAETEVSKMRSVTELCGLRVSVESYVAPKGPLQCKCCQRFGHTQRNCGYAPRCVACGVAHLTGGCSTPREQPQCCGCGGTTPRVTEAVLSGKKRRQPLQSERQKVS